MMFAYSLRTQYFRQKIFTTIAPPEEVEDRLHLFMLAPLPSPPPPPAPPLPPLHNLLELSKQRQHHHNNVSHVYIFKQKVLPHLSKFLKNISICRMSENVLSYTFITKPGWMINIFPGFELPGKIGIPYLLHSAPLHMSFKAINFTLTSTTDLMDRQIDTSWFKYYRQTAGHGQSWIQWTLGRVACQLRTAT